MSAALPIRTRTWPFAARFALLLFGLFLYGLAIRLQLDAAVGLAPWDAFHQGLSRRTGITVGQASITVGLVLIALAWLVLRVRPGLGSILNMLLVGIFIDVLEPVTPHPDGLVVQWLQFALGVSLIGVATGTYIASSMGAGPRDGTVMGLSRKLRQPIGRVRTVVELFVLAGGMLLGGQIGLGTLAFALGIGPAMSLGFRLYGIERSRD